MWCKHWQEEKNRPDRTDHYLMSIAKEVRNLYLMHVGSNAPVSLSDMEIEFSKPTEIKVPEPLTEEEVEEMIRQSKMRWAAMLNANSKE